MNDYLFELCAESLEAARAGEKGGASRVELCAELSIGGVTPSIELTASTIAALSIPVHVLIRPRGGDFVYTPDEYGQMRKQVIEAKQAGAAGVVLGILHEDGRVDVERTRALVEKAYPMKATFHRALDAAPDLSEALEAVIRTGADCLLTSGGKPHVQEGADAIARLREQARGRLDVMAGGGLRLSNLVEVVRRTGVSYLHGSMTDSGGNSCEPERCPANGSAALESDIRKAIQLFREELALRESRLQPAL